jgi:glycerophosphoryl diester phosphodiesterase
VPHPFLDHDGPIGFVHRGGALESPENSLAAFRRAADLGFRYLETDVHVTADGVLVAFHDHRLDRVTDRSGRIGRLPWREVRRARIDGGHPIPRLVDLLEELPDVLFNLDAKHAAAVTPLADLLVRTSSLDRVCLASFSDHRLARLNALLGPRACLSLGPRGVARLRRASLGAGRAQLPPAACVQVPERIGPLPLVDRRFVAAAHARSLQVHVWTVDEPAAMHRLLDLGVDGLMTDRPLVLRAVLSDRAGRGPDRQV